jgi:hypothetical protein
VNRFVGCGPLEFRDRESFTMQIVPAGSNGTRVREEGLPDIGEATGSDADPILRCGESFP